ncbi:type II secretion system F family protein [Candidatus Peregrinibacteria bacterium]|jgi:type IV pilus assembly protein PilC|nr:type II secretion system F family protein [Candidatus Peregrinibacteria bacterium]MBT4148602.1 type II secretion system F family protein [Candidatus Peregrinibacteria bacterium]MBT4366274.1 type II secretion system F family protein [Candidatus Peregrinibacteria bacterium]MBT4455781.1 type II secretion system F family protein [Candidatus Peregrinibacteria bacterium]
MPKQAKGFEFAGKEIFKLGKNKQANGPAKSRKTGKPPIVLNIDDDSVVISEKGKKFLGGENTYEFDNQGFFLARWFKKLNGYMLSHSGIDDDEKANFFHLLSVMINAGVSVIKSLKSLMGQVSAKSHLFIIIKDLQEKVEEGKSLSEAMTFHDKEFSDMEIGMIESGEAAGQLNQTLDNLAVDIARRQDIKHKIKSALMYPIAIIVLLIVVLIVMMVFIIPKLSQLFERQAAELPLVTRIVVGISDFLIEYGVYLFIGLIILAMFMVIGSKRPQGKYIIDKIKLGAPVFGKLFQMTYLARFARSLSNLMSSGVPVVKTMEITANSIGNEVYKRRIMLASEDIKQGIPLAENLSDSKLFPPMLVNMVEVGEKTAQLDEIMIKVAAYYEDNVSDTVNGLAKILEPMILVFIGVSVGVIVAAVMLPIMQLSDISM